MTPEQARLVYRAFTKACRDLGLEPQDPEILLLLSSMIGSYYGLNGRGMELRHQILHQIDRDLDATDNLMARRT